MTEVVTTVFEDNFVEATTVLLDAHTPDVGTDWEFDPGTTALTTRAEVVGGAGYCQSTGDNPQDYVGYFANPAPTIANVDMTVEIGAVSSDFDGYLNLIARYQPGGEAMLARLTEDQYEVIYRNSNVANDWVSVMAGPWDVTLAAGHVVRFRLLADHMELYQDTGSGFVLLSEGSNANVLVAGDCLLGWGSFAEAAGDIREAWQITKFTVGEITGVETGTLVFYDNFIPTVNGQPALTHIPDIEGIDWQNDPSGDSTKLYRLNTSGDVLYIGNGPEDDVYLGLNPNPSPALADIEIETRLGAYHAEGVDGVGYQVTYARRQGEKCYVLRLRAVTDGAVIAELFLRTAPNAGTLLDSFTSPDWFRGDYWRMRVIGNLISIDYAQSSGTTPFHQVYTRVIEVTNDELPEAGSVGIGEGNFVSVEGDLGESIFINAWSNSFFKVAEFEEAAPDEFCAPPSFFPAQNINALEGPIDPGPLSFFAPFGPTGTIQ